MPTTLRAAPAGASENSKRTASRLTALFDCWPHLPPTTKQRLARAKDAKRLLAQPRISSVSLAALPQLARRLCFRVAVRAAEAWLLADAERIAAFLRISRSKVPADPESLDNPKATMVALARASRRMDIREDMVPRDGSGRPVGLAYASRLIEFASSSWRPQIAAQGADSLRRAIACLKRLAGTA